MIGDGDSRACGPVGRCVVRLAVAWGAALGGWLTMPPGESQAIEIPVASAAQISVAMATAKPGAVLVMADGTWTNQAITFAGSGSSAAPITLRPQTPGGVRLNGTSRLTINGNWLIVDGLRFDGGALSGGSDGCSNHDSKHPFRLPSSRRPGP